MRNRLDLPENTEVLLYFSENTDMRKLEKELLDIYGPGKSKSDIHSLYENSINRVKKIEPYKFQIEENVQNDLSYIIQDGNPFTELFNAGTILSFRSAKRYGHLLAGCLFLHGKTMNSSRRLFAEFQLIELLDKS